MPGFFPAGPKKSLPGHNFSCRKNRCQAKFFLLVGIGLDETERNIGEWIAREIGGKTRKSIPKVPKETKQEFVSQPPKDEIEETRKEEKRRIAKQMFAKNYPIEEIILLTGLSAEEIKKLKTQRPG